MIEHLCSPLASALLAGLTLRAREHGDVASAHLRADPPLLLSPFVLAELDYLAQRRLGKAAQLRLLDEIARGAYRLEPFTERDVSEALEILERYSEHDVSPADASVVVLANRHGTRDVLTLDERHLRTLTTSDGKPLRLLPADAGTRWE